MTRPPLLTPRDWGSPYTLTGRIVAYSSRMIDGVARCIITVDSPRWATRRTIILRHGAKVHSGETITIQAYKQFDTEYVAVELIKGLSAPSIALLQESPNL